MAILSRHRFTEGLLSLGSIGALVVAMAVLDETLRGQLVGVLSGESSNKLARAGVALRQATHLVMETGGDYSVVTPLVLFALAGVALLLLMLRS